MKDIANWTLNDYKYQFKRLALENEELKEKLAAILNGDIFPQRCGLCEETTFWQRDLVESAPIRVTCDNCAGYYDEDAPKQEQSA